MADIELGRKYIYDENVPDLLEALMTGVMYHRPDDAVMYLRGCLEKVFEAPAKQQVEGCAAVDSGNEPLSQQPKRYQWNMFIGNKRRRRVSARPSLGQNSRAQMGSRPTSSSRRSSRHTSQVDDSSQPTSRPPSSRQRSARSRPGSSARSRPSSSKVKSRPGSSKQKSSRPSSSQKSRPSSSQHKSSRPSSSHKSRPSSSRPSSSRPGTSRREKPAHASVGAAQDKAASPKRAPAVPPVAAASSLLPPIDANGAAVAVS